MAKGGTGARSTASKPLRRDCSRTWMLTGSTTGALTAGKCWTGRWCRRTAPATRVAATPRARSPKSTTRRRGPDRLREHLPAIPQRLRARHAQGHPILGGRRDLPFSNGGRSCPCGLRGRRPDARLRPRRGRLARQRGGGRGRDGPRRRKPHPLQRLLRASRDHPRRGQNGHGKPPPPRRRWCRGNTVSATCGTLSPPPRVQPPNWGSPPKSAPKRGWPDSLTTRCGYRWLPPRAQAC